MWKKLMVKDGLLWQAYKEESGNSFILQLVGLAQFRQQIIHKLHSGSMGGGNEDSQQSQEALLLAGILE